MQWRDWRDHNGTLTQVAFDRSSGKRQLVVRQTISAARLNQVLDVNTEFFNETRIADVIRGNTQSHRVHIGRIPEELYWRWRRELGDPHRDPDAAKRWKIRLNDHTMRGFRVAEGHI